MLADRDIVTMIGVKDLARAATFYGEVLGLPVLDKPNEEVITFGSGAARLNIYHSEFAGSNQATTALWEVGSAIGALCQALAAKGVPFEHYQMPGMRLEGDVHVGGGMKVAWFRDPDGNILSLTGV